MSNTIYVHIDTTSNAVLTRGLAPQDFNKSIVHQPKNLLLLDPSSDFGEFDGHGLKSDTRNGRRPTVFSADQ